MKYREMTAEQRKAEFEKVSAEFEAWKAKGLKLNMARGRPGKEQLDLVSDILSVMTDPADCVDGDVNVRNYGQLSGLPSAKALFAEILGCKPEQVFVGGNASLQLMYDTIAKAYTNGLLHSEKPWCREEHIKWLCPAPGSVILLVEANSNTMSALPYFSHRLRMSGKGTNSPSNSWMQ